MHALSPRMHAHACRTSLMLPWYNDTAACNALRCLASLRNDPGFDGGENQTENLKNKHDVKTRIEPYTYQSANGIFSLYRESNPRRYATRPDSYMPDYDLNIVWHSSWNTNLFVYSLVARSEVSLKILNSLRAQFSLVRQPCDEHSRSFSSLGMFWACIPACTRQASIMPV